MKRQLAFASVFVAVSLAAQTPPEVGKPLPPWTRGTLDIHQLSTGRGNAAFMRLPDGTTLLVDAGSAADRQPMDDAAATPDAVHSPGEHIVRYVARAMAPVAPKVDFAVVTHFHADHMGQPTKASPSSKSGAFKLAGITEVGESLAIATLIDRGMTYQPPKPDDMIASYQAFVAEKVSAGMKHETLRVGRNDQIVLHDASAFPQFEVRNVAANGVVWTGKGDETAMTFPPLASVTDEDKPSENMCSIGLRISYGNFDYFTGGDMFGVPDAGAPMWQAVELPVAKAIGETDVHLANHHGSISPESAEFLSALKSQVIIFPSWSATHPSQDSLKRALATRLYGAHDVFTVTLREPTKASIGFRVKQLKADHGHIVVRVAPGGETFRVFVIDDTVDDGNVTAVFGPYTSH